MNVTINNPILSGFHPDPSICRVGSDFYLVNSTFEYFPGIPIYHSTDLIHWEQIGHVLTKNSQITYKQGAPNYLGVYAPTIRYYDGTFYCIVTNVGSENGEGNFYCTTKDIYGEWSKPIYTDFEGIDPSLFFDADGRCYYTGVKGSIYLCEMDPKTGKRIGKKKEIWKGTGGNDPEGPHLYRINDMYYLMIAEGGTEHCHMVTIARSKKITGPYESCPSNPVLTNRSTDLPLKSVGHADLVEDEKGDWWAVCLCTRPSNYPFTHNMGRETALVPVEWKDGWPLMGSDGHVLEEMVLERERFENRLIGDYYVPCKDMIDDFTETDLHPSWTMIYNDQGLIKLNGANMVLHGNAVPIWGDAPKAMILRRQEHFEFEARVHMKAELLEEKEEIGFTIYLNPKHHYELVMGYRNGDHCLIFRRQLGTMVCEEYLFPYERDVVEFILRGNQREYSFSYVDKAGSEHTVGTGEVRKLSTECGGCFTGNMIGIYATNTVAKLKYFSYRPIGEK